MEVTAELLIARTKSGTLKWKGLHDIKLSFNRKFVYGTEITGPNPETLWVMRWGGWHNPKVDFDGMELELPWSARWQLYREIRKAMRRASNWRQAELKGQINEFLLPDTTQNPESSDLKSLSASGDKFVQVYAPDLWKALYRIEALSKMVANLNAKIKEAEKSETP